VPAPAKSPREARVQPPPNKDYAFVDDLDDGAEAAPEEAK
jgi:hypothetical protein